MNSERQGADLNPHGKSSTTSISARYKIRMYQSSKVNLKSKAATEAEREDTLFDENYTPFTILSKPALELHSNTATLRENTEIPELLSRKDVPGFQGHKRLSTVNKRLKMPSLSLPPNRNSTRSEISTKLKSQEEKETIKFDKSMLQQIYPKPQQKRQSKLTEKQRSVSKMMFKQKQPHSCPKSVKTKRCGCGDCEECMRDFTSYLQMISDDRSVPQISAKSWCIWQFNHTLQNFSYYYGKRIHKVREIASLSKMVTAMVLIDYLNKQSFSLEKVTFEIRKTSGQIGGTSANLKVGNTYTLKDLLYGMMLPSGNDSAIAISEAVGLMMHLQSKGRAFNPHEPSWYEQFLKKNLSYVFISAMNEKVQKIGLVDTKLFNSHGNDSFDQLKNISTCNEIAKISSDFMNKYPLLRQVVKTAQYTLSDGSRVENTNKLLEAGFDGIKTGITETAGPCLSACYKDLIVVVLNSKSMGDRWVEVKKLVKWMMKSKR